MHKNSPGQFILLLLSLLIIFSGIFLYSQTTILLNKDAATASFYIHQIKKKVKSAIGTKEDPKARARYEFERLRNPFTGKVPENIREKELAFSQKLPRNFALLRYKNNNPTARQLISDWNQRGPFNVAGRTRALAIDASDENNILAGGVSGGMWRSTDGGTSWTKTTDPNMLHSVTTIAQDTRPGKRHIWYHGSGELEGNSAAAPFANYRGNGIYKSTDNGMSWQILPATQTSDVTSFNNVYQWNWRLATNPVNIAQDEVYAATIGGVQRSLDGGSTWANVLGTNSASQSNNYSRYTDIAISSQGVRYATMSQATTSGTGSSPKKGIFRSADGITWTDITPNGFPEVYERIVLSIAPSNEKIVYFLAHTPGFGKLNASIWKYTYVSGNGSGAGGSWENRSANVPDFRREIGDFNSQGNYNMVIQVKPDNPDQVFIGGTNLYVSTNGFATSAQTRWIGGYLENVDPYPNHHPDQHALVFYPSDPNRMLSGHDGGLSRTANVNTPDSVRYESLNRGYITTQAHGIAINLTEADNDLVGGFQDNGSWVAQHASATAAWDDLLFGDGAYAAVTKNSWIVSAQEGFIIRFAFSNANEFLGYARLDPQEVTGYDFVNPYLIDPNNQYVMYLPKGDTLYRNSNIAAIPVSKDGLGEERPNWSIIATVDAADARRITAAAVSTQPANIVYFGTNNGKLFKLTNPGAANPVKTAITGANFPPGYISCIAINPADANEVIVSFSNYGVVSLFQTKDGGTTWTAIAGNLEQNPDGSGNGPSTRWVTILPSQNGGKTKYFVGTSTGLYAASTLQGNQTTWLKEGQTSIGNVPVDMVLSRAVDNLVVVGTHGNGVFSVNYNVDIENEAIKTGQMAVKVYNSPFTSAQPTTIEYTIPDDSRVTIRIYDVAGRLITTLLDGPRLTGTDAVQWNGRSAAGTQVQSGVYIYTVATDTDLKSGKLLFLR